MNKLRSFLKKEISTLPQSKLNFQVQIHEASMRFHAWNHILPCIETYGAVQCFVRNHMTLFFMLNIPLTKHVR